MVYTCFVQCQTFYNCFLVFYTCFVAMPNVFQLFSSVLHLLRGNAKRFSAVFYCFIFVTRQCQTFLSYFIFFTLVSRQFRTFSAVYYYFTLVSRQCQTFFNCFRMLYRGIYHFSSSVSQLKNRK